LPPARFVLTVLGLLIFGAVELQFRPELLVRESTVQLDLLLGSCQQRLELRKRSSCRLSAMSCIMITAPELVCFPELFDYEINQLLKLRLYGLPEPLFVSNTLHLQTNNQDTVGREPKRLS
jgi:hypothetical protein